MKKKTGFCFFIHVGAPPEVGYKESYQCVSDETHLSVFHKKNEILSCKLVFNQ